MVKLPMLPDGVVLRSFSTPTPITMVDPNTAVPELYGICVRPLTWKAPEYDCGNEPEVKFRPNCGVTKLPGVLSAPGYMGVELGATKIGMLDPPTVVVAGVPS